MLEVTRRKKELNKIYSSSEEEEPEPVDPKIKEMEDLMADITKKARQS